MAARTAIDRPVGPWEKAQTACHHSAPATPTRSALVGGRIPFLWVIHAVFEPRRIATHGCRKDTQNREKA